jgi:hypothetical protein
VSTRDEIRAALAEHGPLTCTELAQHCPACENDRQIVARTIAELRNEGKVKGVGLDHGEPVYDIAIWPAEGEQPLRQPASAIEKTAVEQAPDRAPKPVTTPAPARPAAHQEKPTMSQKKAPVAERVVAALKAHGQCDLHQLAKHTGSTAGSLSTTIGKVKGVRRVSRGVYALADGESAPPVSRAAAPARKGPLKRANGKHLLVKIPPPAPSAPRPTNGDAQFAINEAGELGIEAHGQKLRLDAPAFERLRAFIERTKPVWTQ